MILYHGPYRARVYGGSYGRSGGVDVNPRRFSDWIIAFYPPLRHRMGWPVPLPHLIKHLRFHRPALQPGELRHLLTRLAHCLRWPTIIGPLTIGRLHPIKTIHGLPVGRVVVHLSPHLGRSPSPGVGNVTLWTGTRLGMLIIVVILQHPTVVGLAVTTHPRTIVVLLQTH